VTLHRFTPLLTAFTSGFCSKGVLEMLSRGDASLTILMAPLAVLFGGAAWSLAK
jgi:hypothetical protein